MNTWIGPRLPWITRVLSLLYSYQVYLLLFTYFLFSFVLHLMKCSMRVSCFRRFGSRFKPHCQSGPVAETATISALSSSFLTDLFLGVLMCPAKLLPFPVSLTDTGGPTSHEQKSLDSLPESLEAGLSMIGYTIMLVSFLLFCLQLGCGGSSHNLRMKREKDRRILSHWWLGSCRTVLGLLVPWFHK